MQYFTASYRRSALSAFVLILGSICRLYAGTSEQSEYQSSNPYYWKKRLPHPGYWQQDVHYRIDAKLDETTGIISGRLKLNYTNNSQDTLREAFFHLYQNAFQPESYLDELHKANGDNPSYGKYEQQKLGTVIDRFLHEGAEAVLVHNNTILKVTLNKALLPGQTHQFDIDFKTYFDRGSIRRRMKVLTDLDGQHYDGVHWYPRISVYDAKFGWDTQQHLGKEFYGDFGQYEVNLDLPSHFVTEATGVLLNEQEVLPAELKQKLQISNFASKKWGEKSSVITPYTPGERKVWKYKAINVHDFAFTTDPSYRIGEEVWNGVRCIAVVREPHAARWQNAASYTAKIIALFSTDFGMYLYPKMVVADAADGMEYPMLTLDGGGDPDYRSLFAHEIGHNWFFGMVGNNETYRAMLDEGFTQFLTSWAMEKLEGRNIRCGTSLSETLRFIPKSSETRDRYVLNAFRNEAMNGSLTPLNVHSDDFNGALAHGGGYRNVYYKTAAMLYALRYVLGDTLFEKSMRHYFDEWKLCHPYIEDFRSSIIRYTKRDLNWFFDSWIETNKTVDYSICGLKKSATGYRVKLRRKGTLEMPVDLLVTTRSGATQTFHIPNTEFPKQVSGQTILKQWLGWGKLNPVYVAELNVKEKITQIVLDPEKVSGDVDYRNNRLRRKTLLGLSRFVRETPQYDAYQLLARPDFWWNNYDGLKVGVFAEGSYYNKRNKLKAGLWYSSGLGAALTDDAVYDRPAQKIQYLFHYETPFGNPSAEVVTWVQSRILEGLQWHEGGIRKSFHGSRSEAYLFYRSMVRNNSLYLLNPGLWSAEGSRNNTLNAGIKYRYTYSYGRGEIHLAMRSNSLYSDFDYAQFRIVVNNQNRWKGFFVDTRTFFQTGSGRNVPLESALYVAGGNPEEMMDNKYLRSSGFIPVSYAVNGSVSNHFNQSGGMNLRGYAGYVLPLYTNQGIQTSGFLVPSGASITIEAGHDGFTNFGRGAIHLRPYLFTDAGILALLHLKEYRTENRLQEHFRMDAGAGAVLTISRIGRLNNFKPLHIRADFPLFLNSIPYLEASNFAFRWQIGISKTF